LNSFSFLRQELVSSLSVGTLSISNHHNNHNNNNNNNNLHPTHQNSNVHEKMRGASNDLFGQYRLEEPNLSRNGSYISHEQPRSSQINNRYINIDFDNADSSPLKVSRF